MTETILMPAGRLDTAAAPAFEREMIAATAAGGSRLLIDLANLAYVSSAGLRVFLVAAKRLRAEGGRIALCGLQPQVAEVFDISGFAAIVPVYADRQAALAALR
nr:STAS domain-containing protein [uncultured Rhodopila sp.]